MSLAVAEYLKGVADILMEYDETQNSTKWTIAQTLVTGVGTLVGAIVGRYAHPLYDRKSGSGQSAYFFNSGSGKILDGFSRI